jgi:type IV pilus assembly protein PilE
LFARRRLAGRAGLLTRILRTNPTNGSTTATDGISNDLWRGTPCQNRAMPHAPGSPGPRPTVRTSRRGARGFTIVELLIAVVVVGVLAAVALPSFMDSMRKGRRAEAFSAISAAQQAQERFRGNNASYASAISSLTSLGAVATSSNGRYTISVSNASATGYEVLADGTASGQAADGNCAKLAVRAAAGALTYAACATCTSFSSGDFTANNRCWAR